MEAVTVIDNDGNFNIYVNALLPRKTQIRAVRHELRHISKDHFYDDVKDVLMIESEAVL